MKPAGFGAAKPLLLLTLWLLGAGEPLAVAQEVKRERASRRGTNPEINVAEKYGFHLRGKQKIARIPFQLHSNLILVPVRLNNSDTLHFILDTGVSTTILTDPHVPAARQLKSVRRVQISGAGEGNGLAASVALGATLRMGEMTGYNQTIVVLDHDALALSEYVGVPVHGIFGYDIFSHFIVTIDFMAREIILQKPGSYRYTSRKGEKYPITIEDTKPYFEAVAVVADNRTVPLRLLIDTGAGHALSLDVHARSQLRQPAKVVRAQLGRGLSGVINGNLGRVEKVKIGTVELSNILACFPDSMAYGVKFARREDRQGNIGCELLRRFRVTFNYPEKYMVLKPIRRQLREAFEHNMSGMEIIAKGQDFHQFVIERVLDGSPAALAGLEDGDELVSMNNQLCRNMTISDIYKILQRGDGREIVISAKRNGQMFITSFVLRRVI